MPFVSTEGDKLSCYQLEKEQRAPTASVSRAKLIFRPLRGK